MPFVAVDQSTGYHIYCFYHRRSDRVYCFLRDPKTGRWVRFIRIIFIASTCTFDSGDIRRHYSKNIYVESQVVGALVYDASETILSTIRQHCGADPQMLVFPEPFGTVPKSFAAFMRMLWDAEDINAQRCRCCFDQFGLTFSVAGHELHTSKPATYCCKSHFDLVGGKKEIRSSKCYELLCEPRCRLDELSGSR